MAREPDLPPLREVIARHRLGAVKALGQHFLLDLNLTRRIARAAGPLAGGSTIEVGPGPGGLTRALLLEGAGKVYAIEKDRRCLGALAELAEAFPGASRSSRPTRSKSTWRPWGRRPGGSSPTCPTTSRPRC